MPAAPAQPQLTAIGEARRGVDHDDGRAQCRDEAACIAVVARRDHFGVIGAEAPDVREGVVERVHHARGDHEIEKFRRVVFRTDRQHACGA